MTARSDGKRLVSMVPATLSALLDVPEEEVHVRGQGSSGCGLVASAAGQTFAVEVSRASAAGPVAAHADRAAEAATGLSERAIPVVAVPFMGQSGNQACQRAGASRFDFSGNAHIIATGLSAAWQLTHFATFRIATFFLDEEPDEVLRDKLDFQQDSRGANLRLVVPNDAGVFQGAQDRDGVRCVHPVQAFLDLKEHPERAAEAADRVRAEHLTW